jgi:hypothetical protein
MRPSQAYSIAILCEYIPDPREMLAVRKALDADREDEAA